MPEEASSVRFAIKSSALILAATAFVKLVSAFQGGAYLLTPDPVFGIFDNGQVLCLAGAFELAIAAALLLPCALKLKVVLLLATSNLFIGYRIGRLIMRATGHCMCFGYLGHWLHLHPAVVIWIGYVSLAYLVGAGYYCWVPALVFFGERFCRRWKLARPSGKRSWQLHVIHRPREIQMALDVARRCYETFLPTS